MPLSDWLISIAALGWLLVVAWFDVKTRQVPHLAWTGVPLLVAAVYRLATGHDLLIVAAAAVAVVVSERRHLQQRVLETIILVAGVAVLVWLLFTTGLATAYGIVGVIVFWGSWELRYIGGADAMTLITCLIVWPGIEFVLAYLLVGIVWSLAVRIRQGGWLKGHAAPGLALVAAAAVLYLMYQVYRSLKI